MKKSAYLFVSVLILFAAMNTPVFAHDGSWDVNVPSWNSQVLGHDDLDPWKGWASVTITNTMLEDWGDFHFEIYEPGSYNVIFPTSETMLMEDNLGNPYSGYTYAHDGTQMLDFEFYGNPVGPGETVTFKVYTDNTVNQHSWFGLTVYPTPVPEPATIVLLSLGGMALLRKRRK